MVKEINAQSRKLSFLISSLIQTSRLETGIITVSPSVNAVERMLEDVIGQIKPRAMEKSITILREPTNATASFDYKWTCEALLNILDNAVKYTNCNGQIKVSVSAYEMFCRIDVTDNGIGIAEFEQNKVFARFYRSQAVSRHEGVGIGLYLAREIIEKQGGYIKLTSQLQKGATFSVFLARHK